MTKDVTIRSIIDRLDRSKKFCNSEFCIYAKLAFHIEKNKKKRSLLLNDQKLNYFFSNFNQKPTSNRKSKWKKIQSGVAKLAKNSEKLKRGEKV